MSILLIFGDSTTQGFWDAKGGWADRLKAYLFKKGLPSKENYFSVFNLGVSGDTSKDLLERFESETKARIVEREKDEKVIILFSIGTNDSIYNNKTKKHLVSPKQFSKNIDNLFKLAKKHSDHIVFLEDLPIDENKVDQIPWVKDCSYKNEFLQQYSNIAKDLCEKHNVHLISIWNKLVSMNYKELLEDGCHPNTKGHELIFNIVKENLEKNNLV